MVYPEGPLLICSGFVPHTWSKPAYVVAGVEPRRKDLFSLLNQQIYAGHRQPKVLSALIIMLYLREICNSNLYLFMSIPVQSKQSTHSRSWAACAQANFIAMTFIWFMLSCVESGNDMINKSETILSPFTAIIPIVT